MTIPAKPRFDYCRKRAHQFITDNRIRCLPVDPFTIAQENGWRLMTVDFLKTLHQDRLDFIKSNDADTIRFNNDYLIIYNDKVESLGRVRWTIMHEIGHIVLGHLIDFQQTRVSRLADGEYEVLEKEANAFAAEVLAPTSLLIMLKITSPEEIMSMCHLSKEASDVVLKRLNAIRWAGVPDSLYKFYKHQFKYYFEGITAANRTIHSITAKQRT